MPVGLPQSEKVDPKEAFQVELVNVIDILTPLSVHFTLTSELLAALQLALENEGQLNLLIQEIKRLSPKK